MISVDLSKKDFQVFILGMTGNFRNQIEIDKRYGELSISQIDAFNSKSPEVNEIELNSRVFHFWYNRGITKQEAACALGHRKIINLAYLENKDFVLILEDDAEIPSLDEIRDHSLLLKREIPTLLLLANNINTVLLSKRSQKLLGNRYKKCLSIPTHTQAYALNRSAIELIYREQQNRNLNSLADYPPWYSEFLEFIMYLTPGSIAPAQTSTIGIEGRNSPNSNFFRRVYRFSFLAWLLEGWRYCNLLAYTRFVHGRAIGSLQMKIIKK